MRIVLALVAAMVASGCLADHAAGNPLELRLHAASSLQPHARAPAARPSRRRTS